jgi:hypothetical protein
MRKIVHSTYISLDGVIERPHEWPSVGPRGCLADPLRRPGQRSHQFDA